MMESARPASATSAAHPRTGPKPAPPPCKAATVLGEVHVVPFVGGMPDGGGPALVAATAVPDDAWIDVAKGGRLTTRDAVSTRESSYEGPGRFRVCIGHKEEAWVQAGVFESVGGAGERPGAEEWIATPLGAARYDAVKWKITVTDRAVDVRVSAGTGYVWPAPGVAVQYFAEAGPLPETNDQGWIRLDGGTGARLSVPKSVLTPDGAKEALDGCVTAAKETMAITASLAEPDANLAVGAARDVVARRTAHAACATAHLRIETMAPSPVRDASMERVRTAEAAWEALTPPPEHAGHPAAPGN